MEREGGSLQSFGSSCRTELAAFLDIAEAGADRVVQEEDVRLVRPGVLAPVPLGVVGPDLRELPEACGRRRGCV